MKQTWTSEVYSVTPQTPSIRKSYTYDDLILSPQYTEIHRSDVKLTSNIGTHFFNTPVISSPMSTVTELDMATEMSNQKSLALIHRYCTIEEQVAMIKSTDHTYVGAAIGNSKDFKERAESLFKAGCDILCIDVAHADSLKTINAIESIRSFFGGTLIVGNIATRGAAMRLAKYDIDALRVGIGGGAICKTRTVTGHGVPNITAISDVYLALKDTNNLDNIKIIADGGIRTSGDAVKALAMGASFIMVGSVLAGTSAASGQLLSFDGKQYMTYMGMASNTALNSRNDSSKFTGSVEGVEKLIPYKGDTSNILNTFVAGIKQGLFYSGVKTIKELQQTAEWYEITTAGIIEGTTHGKTLI